MQRLNILTRQESKTLPYEPRKYKQTQIGRAKFLKWLEQESGEDVFGVKDERMN